MDFFRTMLRYASDAWSFITGLPGDVGNALQHVWNFTGSLARLVDHLVANVLRHMLAGYLDILNTVISALENTQGELDRVKAWIYFHEVMPLRTFLLVVMDLLAKRIENQLAALRALVITLYLRSLAYANSLVAAERKARIADVKAARAYSLHLVNALHSQIEAEAASAYNANTKARQSVITKITDDIVTRNPVIRSLVADFVRLLIDVIGADNPVARIALQFALTKIVDSLGVDKVAGDLLSRLIGPLAADGKARSVHDAITGLTRRMSATEDQWADFMANGGPDVEQAGRDWKKYDSLAFEAALTGFVVLAAADPGQWASVVAGTAGRAVGDTAAAIARLAGK